MSGSTKLAPVAKGTLIDVLEIDQKSKQWVLTSILNDGKDIKGWISRRDLTSVPKTCAKGFSYECKSAWFESCTKECDPPSCHPVSNYECNYEYGYNPQTGEYEYFNKYEYVTKQECTQGSCTEHCVPYKEDVCSCVGGK
jgi:predicted RNA-binding protein